VKGTNGYPHMPILRPLAARRFAGRFWASGGAKFPKMGDSLPGTPMNHRAKFDDITIVCLSACVDNTWSKNFDERPHRTLWRY